MLEAIGARTMEDLIGRTVPAGIRLGHPLDLPDPVGEAEALAELAELAARNRVIRSHLGMGYQACLTPGVIQRNILENPGWYTQYTPYQAEIAQGRLEALLNFQTLVADLTGLDVANASLLDEPTAAAEAMSMAQRLRDEPGRDRMFVAQTCHPQTVAVVAARAEPLGITLLIGDPATVSPDATWIGALVQYPDTLGAVADPTPFFDAVRAAGALAICATDLLALTLLRSPGECGADIAVGSAQRFGVPMGFGGPHAAFMAVRDAHKRQMPGRLVGLSRDAAGNPALRLALQTREQHIRRDKATSNICTAQVLLAVMASMYAVYHGPDGLRAIARRVRSGALDLADRLRAAGIRVASPPWFDTLCVEGVDAGAVIAAGVGQGINLRRIDSARVGIALDETTSDLGPILRAFGLEGEDARVRTRDDAEFAPPLARTSPYLTHPVFHAHRTETELLRYIRKLESRDLSLTTSMIPLGSCTMKLNATAEMLPVSWPAFAQMHPFAPADQTAGYRALFDQLERWLAEITGFAATSLQPNAGSQGEYAGLLVIRAWHRSRGDNGRDVCLIPVSAHGTNPASATMCGFRVVAIACDASGNVDLADLRAKAAAHASKLAALMVTYPSTHGVFEESIREICEIVHGQGGQVYMDGANLNAQVGLCRPGDIGADVCHLNLHKTFCIPHGGGGPGMGPICVAAHLAPFLPTHPVVATGGPHAIGAVSGAPWGSASILVIPWMYIRMMGAEGLRRATEHAILNANYIAARLAHHYPVLYRGTGGFVAHECILDLRPLKTGSGIEVEDVAKRLMDYGFHAPTMSWPVAGTLMVEPTESESKEELDRFCDALIGIKGEIDAVASGALDARDNPLKQAPHTARAVTADHWPHGYPRELAAYPSPWTREHKFWPHVARVDNVYGDRNLFCSCPPVVPF